MKQDMAEHKDIDSMLTTKEAEYRDRKGWRLFTEDEINKLMAEVNRIQEII